MDSTIYKKIENYLLELIEQNKNIPGFKLPSERALSVAFNASRKPVRHAYDQLLRRGYVTTVHGKGYFISDTLQQEASATVRDTGISLIIPSVQTHFDQSILRGIGIFCQEHQVELTIHLSDSSAVKEDILLHSAANSGTNGIILFPTDDDSTYHKELYKLSLKKYPLVLVDRNFSNIHASFVSSENHQAMVNAVEYLYKRQLDNLVYITTSPDASTVNERINGFTHGLLRYYKMAMPKNLLILPGGAQQKRNAIVKYLQDHPDTRVAIVAGVQRQFLVSAAAELGIRIPQDLKLMLFDDELQPAERNTLRPYIIQQDGFQIGYLAAQTLYNHIYGDMRPVTHLLPVEIIDTNTETFAQ